LYIKQYFYLIFIQKHIESIWINPDSYTKPVRYNLKKNNVE